MDKTKLLEQHYQFVADMKAGLQEEHQITYYIRRYLLTGRHQAYLTNRGLTVEDLLNGRFPIEDSTIVSTIFDVWNMQLGSDVFGLHMGK